MKWFVSFCTMRLLMRLTLKSVSISAHQMQRTFEFVHKHLTRVWLHGANTSYMVLICWHVFRRMLKHTTISAPFDFDNKDRAPNSFVTQRNTAFRRCFLTLFPQGTHHVDAQEVPTADRVSNAGRAVLSAFSALFDLCKGQDYDRVGEFLPIDRETNGVRLQDVHRRG
jgi:hypothetical protein